MVRGLKMNCDLVEYICIPIFILANILFALAEVIEAPFRLTGQFVYFSYLHFERRIANRRRLQQTGGNAHNIVTRLPSEVNIIIFQQVYARKDLESFLKSNHPSEFCQDRTRFNYRSLHSAAMVCRSWNADATIALYESVYLDNDTRLLAFARTLLARPQLCPLVRLIGLPHRMRQSPPYHTTDGPFQDPAVVAIKNAVERVLSQCTNARHLCLPLLSDTPNHNLAFEPAYSFVIGLRQVLMSPVSRVSTLKLQGSSNSTRRGPEWDLILPLPNDANMRQGFQRLTTLIISCANLHRQTLADPRWRNQRKPALPTLKRFVISHSSLISREPFARLLAQTPALESLQMSDVISDETGHLNMEVMNAISQCASTLTHLRLVNLHMSVTLGNMHQFVRLRSLVLESGILFHRHSATGVAQYQLTVPPPNLEELVILHKLPRTRTTTFNVNPLSLISAFRDTITSWRVTNNLPPRLRNIELWSILMECENAWRDWEIGTYILRNLLNPYDIHVETFLSYVILHWLSPSILAHIQPLRIKMGSKEHAICSPNRKVFRRERRIEGASSFWRRIILKHHM